MSPTARTSPKSRMSGQPKVRDAVVILADRLGQPRLTAYLEVRSGLHPHADELRRFMRSRLPDHMVPAEYFVVDAFPLLPSAKIDRRILALQTSANPLGDRATLPPKRRPRNALLLSGATCSESRRLVS